MIDHAERITWEAAFLRQALDVAGSPITRRKREKIAAWAASMAKIAEQFAEPDDDELEDA